MRKLAALFLALTLPAAGRGADLKGTVVDRATGAALPGATVRLQDPPTATPRTLTAGADGSVSFSVVAFGDNFTVQATAQGYYGNGLNVMNWNGLGITLQLSAVPP